MVNDKSEPAGVLQLGGSSSGQRPGEKCDSVSGWHQHNNAKQSRLMFFSFYLIYSVWFGTSGNFSPLFCRWSPPANRAETDTSEGLNQRRQLIHLTSSVTKHTWDSALSHYLSPSLWFRSCNHHLTLRNLSYNYYVFFFKCLLLFTFCDPRMLA